MNCLNCGQSMKQGPNGDWACGNYGGTGVAHAGRCSRLVVMTDESAPYYTTDICSECQETVQGLHGRWTCRSCGTNSPYIPPPEGWQTDPSVGIGIVVVSQDS
jgi:hypothetical protein